MIEQDCSFSSGDCLLEGTLCLPRGEGPFPSALLLPGSGPIDRNSDHKKIPLGVTRHLAHALAEGGWASFRFDRRGTGKSAGEFLRAGFIDNRNDAARALDFMGERGELQGMPRVVIGHSEGALHAASLASGETQVAGAVLLAGPAKTGRETLKWQAKAILATLPKPVRWLATLLGGTSAQKKQLDRIAASKEDVMRLQLVVKLNARWFREFLAFDPQPVLRQIHVPVLALTGDKDIQVDPHDLITIGKLVAGPVETVLVPDLSHILRPEPKAHSSTKRYKRQAQSPTDPRVLETVVQWLQKLDTSVGEHGRSAERKDPPTSEPAAGYAQA